MTNTLKAADLVEKLRDLCLMHGLSYDSTPPVQVSPGVWMFQATPLHQSCRREGQCRQQTYYAAMIGKQLKLS